MSFFKLTLMHFIILDGDKIKRKTLAINLGNDYFVNHEHELLINKICACTIGFNKFECQCKVIGHFL